MSQLLFDEDFRDYREREIEIALEFIAMVWSLRVTPEYVRGATDAVTKILNIPLGMAKTKEQEEAARKLVADSITKIEKKILLRRLGVTEGG